MLLIADGGAVALSVGDAAYFNDSEPITATSIALNGCEFIGNSVIISKCSEFVALPSAEHYVPVYTFGDDRNSP